MRTPNPHGTHSLFQALKAFYQGNNNPLTLLLANTTVRYVGVWGELMCKSYPGPLPFILSLAKFLCLDSLQSSQLPSLFQAVFPDGPMETGLPALDPCLLLFLSSD